MSEGRSVMNALNFFLLLLLLLFFIDVVFEVHQSVKTGLMMLEVGSVEEEQKFLQVNVVVFCDYHTIITSG